MSLPWRLSAPDPHDLFDPMAAFFGSAVFDTLYRSGPATPYPSLASDIPRALPGGRLIVPLRPHLLTATGATLDPGDVAASLERARRGAAIGLLAPFGKFVAHRGNEAGVETRGADALALAHALSSEATAIVRAERGSGLVGTGAFAIRMASKTLELVRNEHAARGASFVSRLVVRRAPDLATSLRAFEAGDSDIGFLGAGLHGPRRGATPLEGPRVGWVVLRAGQVSGRWGSPGIVQRLLDEMPVDRLEPMGLHTSRRSTRAEGYRGPSGELLVDADSAYMIEVGRTVAASLQRPGHELHVRPIPAHEIDARRRDGAYLLMLDWVRRIGRTREATQLSLLTAADPQLARHPPRGAPATAEDVARQLTLGVVGELAVTGFVAPGVSGLQAWDLPNAWLER